ncbi:hypothetical protein EV385_0392 [Krasilnikovia cinnamomea]|uniref:Uncharacterized protein n=1 Tax=Krasilnikovia cinnamomea TaxID=349313 RepID=A0A4Q7ZEG6_9ACTN|nr:hypothetical protein [Krasilnikovia cinnamomea]RZU48674.1 hypothetical protein EV385_0392 [Krasilnikovia cinnamomea]
MRLLRGWAPLLGWLAATVAGVALSSVALLPVLRAAAPAEQALTSVHELAGQAARPQPSVTVPDDVPPTTPAPPAPSSASPTPSASASRPGATRSRSATPAPETEAEVRDGWTVTTDEAGVTSYTRSFLVEGGQAVIRMSDGRMQLVTATPAAGYSVEKVQQTPDNLAVFFIEQGHHFVIHAVVRDGQPFAEVSEIGG